MEEEEIILDSCEWNKSFSLSLKNLQEGGLLCDTIIVCMNNEGAPSGNLVAHACVLAASSPILKTLLLQQNSDTSLKQVDSMGFSELTWKVLLDFMYTSRVVLQAGQRDVLKDLQSAAITFEVTGLYEAIDQLPEAYDKKKPKEVEIIASESAVSEEQVSPVTNENVDVGKRSKRLAIKREKRKLDYDVNDEQMKGIKSVHVKLEKLDNEQLKNYWPPAKKRLSGDDYDLMDIAVEEGELKCSICGGSFKGKRLLNRHVKLFHPQLKSHYCNNCGAQFDTKIHLNDHHRREHKAKLLDCLVCYKKFITKDAWRRHTRLYHPDMYRAVKDHAVDIEEKALKSDLAAVKFEALNESSLRPLESISELADTAESDVMETAAVEIQQPASHFDDDDDDHDDDEAATVEIQQPGSPIDDHDDDDDDDDDYVPDDDDYVPDDDITTVTFEEASSMTDLLDCKECEFQAESRTDLIEHMLSHADTKPYICSLCPKVFKSQPGLTLHQHRRHPDKFQGRVKCLQCPRLFSNKGELEDHQRLHHGAKPIKCKHCDRTFRTRDSIYRHERFKHNILSRREQKRNQIFNCQQCDIEFRYNFQLDDHMRKEHGAPPLVCEECGTSVTTRDALYRHRRYNHAKKDDEEEIPLDPEQLEAMKEAEEWNKQHSKFKCSKCDYAAMSRFSLREHEKKHSDSKNYNCPICSKAFKYKVGMHNHKLRHHPEMVEKKFSCADCKEVFGREVHLDDHLRLKHGGDPLKCELCGKQYRTHDAMYRHKRFKHPAKYRRKVKVLKKCEKCGYTTLGNAAFQMHLLTHSNVRAFVCEICGADFKYKGDLSKHTKITHMPDYKPKTYICETCGAHCRNQKILRRHFVSRHQKEFQRTFGCPICNKEFGSKTTRGDHIRYVHEGTAIVCEFCNLTLSDADEWYQHKQAEHPDMVTRVQNGMYSCNLCSKLFKKVVLLRRHERYHVTVRPFCCNVCQQSFVAKEDLVMHHKIHTGAKPYSCPHCPFRTLRKPTLTVHMKKHTNQLLQCPRCEKTYLLKASLAKHLRNAHNIEDNDAIVVETLKMIAEQEKLNMNQDETVEAQIVNIDFANQLQHGIKMEKEEIVSVVETGMDVLSNIAEIECDTELKTEEVVEEVDGGQQIFYVMSDDKETGHEMPTGQELMYIKVSDNQYIQVVNPSYI